MRAWPRAVISVGISLLFVIGGACSHGSKTAPVSPTTPRATVSTRPKPTAAGLYIVTANKCLNIRPSPSLKSPPVGCAPPGSTVRADGASKKADGYNWLRISYKEFSGWAASKFLARRSRGPSP